MPTLTLHHDARAFIALVRAHLEAREAENGLLIGLLARQAGAPSGEPAWLARLHEGDRTIAVAQLTPVNLVVSRGMARAAAPLAEALLAHGRHVPGIVGPEDDAVAVSEAWARVSGGMPCDPVEQMLYALRAVDWPEGVPGRMRPMREADVDLVTAWVWAFHRDALPHEPYSLDEARANAAARSTAGTTYLWEVDGVPVAMAALARPTTHGITVNAVYTPPEHRRHGYATALVAGVSDEGLKRGKAFCILYTDLANPTSNAIYQKIGYRPIGRARRIRIRYDGSVGTAPHGPAER